MNSDKRYLVVLLTALMLVGSLAGCVSEGDESDWKDPTLMELDIMAVNETGQKVELTLSLKDKDGAYTKADGQLRVAIWDSKDFEMLNKTFEVRKNDFFGIIILSVKLSQYTLEIPFADLAKSHDRGYDSMAGDNTMHAMVWFTFKDDTFTAIYDEGLLNPGIPDALLHPNAPPEGDLVTNNPGFVGMAVVCNASGSFDPEGGTLEYEWDWGDGDGISRLLGEAEESHIYDTAGTYTISMKVIDPEEAETIKTIDVTVDWAMAITIRGWGIETEGDYVDNTYVAIYIENMAPEEVSIPQAGKDGIILKDAADEMTDPNGTDLAIPETLNVGGSVAFRVYFDPVEGFTPTKVDVWGRELGLP